LAFGDFNEKTQDFDDLVVTDNGDTEKVLITVVHAVFLFYTKYPNVFVFACGSTKARTRLYRIGITRYYQEMKKDFYLYGQIGDDFVEFEIGKEYEYQIIRTSEYAKITTINLGNGNDTITQYLGLGYAVAGIDIPAVQYRGKVLIIVDSTIADPLALEIETLKQDLIKELWNVVIIQAPRTPVFNSSSIDIVKTIIKVEYDKNPDDLKSRVDVTKFLCNYIRENNLQNPTDKRQIVPDAKLSKLIKYDSKKESEPLRYYSLQKFLKPHFMKVETA
jgi:hypothetical protein